MNNQLILAALFGTVLSAGLLPNPNTLTRCKALVLATDWKATRNGCNAGD